MVGNDGETHQGIFDLSYLSTIPNINILAPKNFFELENMLEFAVNLNEPVVIRYPKGTEGDIKSNKIKEIKLGKAEIIKSGKDISIIAIGKMVLRAQEVSNILKENNISSEIINVRFLKPLDEKTILKSVTKTKKVITIEDNLLKGGLGTSVIKAINESNIENVKVKTFGYNDTFVKHGKVEELEKTYGLDAYSIAEYITNELR